jgi:hypothetical protein
VYRNNCVLVFTGTPEPHKLLILNKYVCCSIATKGNLQHYFNSSYRLGTCLTHTHADKPQDELDTPVQYSKSKAATWKAQDSRSGGYYDDYPSYQAYVVTGSLAVFLLYFCVLREENDIDEELGKSLYERIPGLEKAQLEVAYRQNSLHGHDTSAITARLQELQEK